MKCLGVWQFVKCAHNSTHWMIHFKTIQVLLVLRAKRRTFYQHVYVYAYALCVATKMMIYSMCAHPPYSFFIDLKYTIVHSTEIENKRKMKTEIIFNILGNTYSQNNHMYPWASERVLIHTIWNHLEMFVMRFLLFDYSWSEMYAIIKIKDTKEHSPEQIRTNDDGDESVMCDFFSFFFHSLKISLKF